MRRVCNSCGNTGLVHITIGQSTPHEETRPCYACSEVRGQFVAGLPIIDGSSMRDEPRYVLQKRIPNSLNVGDYRWFTTLRTEELTAIETRLQEHMDKGATAADFRVIDNRR